MAISKAGTKYDVVVVGAGNAALTAAMSARQAGARVLVLEKAPHSLRGGNSRFSGGPLPVRIRERGGAKAPST